MAEYEVRWVSDSIDAEDPVDAARIALGQIMDRGSIAHVFEVRERVPPTAIHTIDLDKIDGRYDDSEPV